MITIPENVRVLFLGDVGDIPAGFTRDTAFNGLYIRACDATATTGGTTGGEASHSHSVSSHHDHGMSIKFASEIVQGKVTSASVGADSDHTHELSYCSIENEEFNWLSTDNSPSFYSVLVVSSDGTKGILTNIAGFSEKVVLDTLTEKTETRNLLLRGLSFGSHASSDSHGHTASARHTHSATTTTESKARECDAGKGAAYPHVHNITLEEEYATIENSTSIPPYYTLKIMYNAGAERSITKGFIGMWTGTKSTIPEKWSEVEGIRGKFVRSSDTPTSTGGASTHSHEGIEHKHTISYKKLEEEVYGAKDGDISLSAIDHKHEAIVDTTTVGTDEASHIPPYIDVFFIRYNGENGWYNWYKEV